MSLRYILVVVFLMSGSVCAEETEFPPARHAIGFGGGGVVGTGLTYRHYHENFYSQFAFFARITEQDNLSLLMGGVSLGRKLSELPVSKALPPTALVFFGGVSGNYSKKDIAEGNPDELRDIERSVQTGVGIALDIGNTFTPGLLFSIGTTYALSMEDTGDQWEWDLGPLVNFTILYNW